MEESAGWTFEQAFEQLREAVQQLEKGDLPLEESLILFERAMALARFCEVKLDEAEQRVQQLVDSGTGAPTLAPFSVEE